MLTSFFSTTPQRVPSKQHSTVLAASAALSGKPANAASVRAHLMQLDLPKSVIDELEFFATLCEDVESAHAKLARVIPVDR